MADIRALIAQLARWQEARDALEELSALPLETKSADVYPGVIKVAVRYWCDTEGPSNCGYELEGIVEFMLRELAVEPDLANALYTAMGKRRPKHREYHFYKLVRVARDRRALPLMRGLWKGHTSEWADTVVALGGEELADDVLAALVANPMFSDIEFATAAGFLAGERAIEPLLALHDGKGYRKEGFALGLVFAGHDDEAFFKAVSSRGEGANAKRMFIALHKPKQKDRLAALDALGKNIELARTYVTPPTLLFASRLLGDPDPVIVERAAKMLADYPASRGEHQNTVHHTYFLAQARAAIARGVTPATRKSLDIVQKSIPRSEPFGAGAPAPAAKLEVDARTAAAEQRAREKLDAMGVAPGAPSAPGAKTAAKVPAKPTTKAAAAAKAKKPFGAALGELASTPTQLRDALPAKAGSNRNPALDAQLAEDPSDRARYLVYGDWLQQQGDPRGALVALHDAADRGDKGAADAAALLLREYRYALLGLLDGVNEIELEWQLGFIRHAHLRYDSQKALLAGLATLLDAESARFLRSIAIDPVDRKAPDGVAITKSLIAHAPRTLSQISIGKPGTWTIPDELRAAFPRLERDPNVVWDEVLEKVAEQKRLEIKHIDPKALPKLVPVAGKPAADPKTILVGLRAEIEKAKPIGIVAALPRTFTRDSVDAFALALAEQWAALADQGAAKWAFDCIGALGGDACAKFLGKNLATFSHQRAVQALEHLKRIGSDLALYQIVRLVLLPGLQPRRDAAGEMLEAIAKARGCSFDDLLDELQPPDTDVLVQRAWLTRLLVHGHRIAPVTFKRIATHPVRGRFAATLVWGTFAGGHDLPFSLVDTFAVARDGSLRASDGKPFELGDSRVGLVHPVELSRELLDTWRETIARRDLEQAIPQLDRPTFRMSAADANTDSLDWFAKRRAGFSLIQTTLGERDWTVYSQYDAGGTESFARRFERGNVTAVASFGDSMGAIATVTLHGKTPYDRRRFASLDPVTQSELLYDLELAHGYREAARGAPARPAPAPAPRGDAPIVERAKSGRSKCVVCEQTIAKGDPRIGVERQIQTDAFTGRGTVWSHLACREGMPELADLDLAPLLAALG